jgi:hypothetical protein
LRLGSGRDNKEIISFFYEHNEEIGAVTPGPGLHPIAVCGEGNVGKVAPGGLGRFHHKIASSRPTHEQMPQPRYGAHRPRQCPFFISILDLDQVSLESGEGYSGRPHPRTRETFLNFQSDTGRSRDVFAQFLGHGFAPNSFLL